METFTLSANQESLPEIVVFQEFWILWKTQENRSTSTLTSRGQYEVIK